nr:MAG TPA: hypothetical protein [Caudoviricetes sp.]
MICNLTVLSLKYQTSAKHQSQFPVGVFALL